MKVVVHNLVDDHRGSPPAFSDDNENERLQVTVTHGTATFTLFVDRYGELLLTCGAAPHAMMRGLAIEPRASNVVCIKTTTE